MTIIARNTYADNSEIDLIARDKHCIVFIEVKYRASARYGGALASVTHKKQQKLIGAAEAFLCQNAAYKNFDYRFDVIAFEGDNPIWIKNAFEALDSWI